MKKKGRGKLSDASDGDTLRLVHELEVHQLELAMQNEELCATRNALEVGLARYRTLFDFAPIGYLATDVNLVIRDVNYAGARLLASDRWRLVGRSLTQCIAVADRPKVRALVRQTLDSHGKECCNAEICCDGMRRAFALLTAMRMTCGEITVLIAMEDITERKLRDEQLQRTERALLEADRCKDDFLATLSHELRNPLAPIRNSLVVLENVEINSDKAARARDIIQRQVVHLTRLVDDLLDVNRIGRGKIQLRREAVELCALARRTLDDHQAQFELSGVALMGELHAEPLWVDADPARVVQALSNLLGNAEKFTPTGGTVRLRLRCEDGRAVIAVQDDGAGMTADVLEKLFEPFSQAPQTLDRSRGGLGLGLAMVKGLVEMHGGTVHAHSEGEGKGSELTMTLCLIAAPSAAPKPVGTPSCTRRRMLVIEDNPDAAESLKDALATQGHEVRVAHDGPVGLAMAHEFRPEVVICDIGMPRMDGYAVARAFRADAQLRNTYMISLSGYGQPEDFRRASEAGFDRHVVKPANLEVLRQFIN